MEIYVSNLPDGTDVKQLTDLFEPFGEVGGVRIDKVTFTRFGRHIAFVNMKNREEGTKAIEALDLKKFNGKKLAVRGR
jgi:RNA recognition motif-containing protein